MPNQYSKSRENRLKAIENCEKTYESETNCRKCGSNIRYVSNKSCVSCSIEQGLKKLNNKELMDPYRTKEKNKRKLDNWREKNPEKYQSQYKNEIARERSRDYYKNNKDRAKERYLLANYGITLEQYNVMLENQNEKCKICGNVCPSGKSLAVDHDHDTKKIRGLLCKNCNIGLGLFFDNISLLETAIEYLKND